MKRAYLEEDLELIRKYFPGAKTVNLRTPFDLTRRPVRRAEPTRFRDIDTMGAHWLGALLWTR